MHELIEAVCKLLAEAGVTVVRQFYPGAAPELDAPVTAVGLQGAKSGAAGRRRATPRRRRSSRRCPAARRAWIR